MRRGARTAALVAVTSALVVVPATNPAVAAEICQTNTSGTITICAPDPELTGRQTVSASVTGLATTTNVRFTWDDNDPATGHNPYLLTDHDVDTTGDYSLLLESARLPSNKDITLTATARSGSTNLGSASVPVRIAPHSGPATVAPFTPRVGTPPGPGERFRLAAVGDGVDGSPASRAVADQITGWDPDVFAYLGDVYDNGSAYEFDTWAGDDTWYGRFRDITNPTVGNHEYRTDSAAPYFSYWGEVPHHYSYDVAGWHVIVLDSTTEYSQVAPGTPQYQWLEADLAANSGACTIAYLHHARYSGVDGVGRTGLADMWTLMHDAGVSMLVTGHAHTYERWMPLDAAGNPSPGGMTQFIVGTGGREIQNPTVEDSRIANRRTIPGALRLDLGPDDAEFTFASTDGTSFTDSGTIPCRQSAPPPTTPPPTATPTPTPTPTPTTPSASPTLTSPAPAPTSTTVAVPPAPSRTGTTAPLPTVRSQALLRDLRRAPERRSSDFAVRRFPRWTDADRDGCSTASEVLIEEARRDPAVLDDCALTGGRWFSSYDGKFRSRAGALAIDHLVSLRETWRSGAYGWTKAERRRFANDLGNPATLVAVTRAAAADKDGQEPQDWLPRRARRCGYAADWVAVKWRWGLAVDRAERRFLTRTLSACGWPSVRATARVT